MKSLVDLDNLDAFYHTSEWRKLRKRVLEFDRHECQICKAKGRYRKAVIVHHVKHLDERPDLALEMFDEFGNRQLVSVCKHCHEELHPDSLPKFGRMSEPLTEERWD